MPLSAIDQWFTIGSSVTAVVGASQMFTGGTIDLKTGAPRKGYDLTVNINSIYTAATNAGANASTSVVSYTHIAEFADDTAFTSNLQQLVFEPALLNFVLTPASTGLVTAGVRSTLRASTAHRYARVRIITPSGPNNTVNMITTKMEALLGFSTPA